MRKPILKFCLAILLFVCISAAASAQQDLSTPDSLRIGFHAMTENAKYVDVLIKINADDPNYIEENIENLEQLSFDKEKIAEYETDGFASLSAHFKGIKTDMEIGSCSNGYLAPLFSDGNTSALESVSEYDRKLRSKRFMKAMLSEHSTIKIVILDQYGNALDVSGEINIAQTEGKFLSSVQYYQSSNYAEVIFKEKVGSSTENNPVIKIFLCFAAIAVVLYLFIRAIFVKINGRAKRFQI